MYYDVLKTDMDGKKPRINLDSVNERQHEPFQILFHFSGLW